ncbi:g3257 [Coccomyxa viridis]|uniref:peptidyl-tRNA hydrolase n=1 Tax=Coccomyxa viridis TaxID=1274662 RepID=A0ABP1FSR3_9CHLO
MHKPDVGLRRTHFNGSYGPDSAVANATDASASTAPEQSVLVQYVVLRADLWKEMEWPLGSIIAQACHAATAALWQSREADSTKQYCSADQLDHMHKVVLEIKGETQLLNLASKLQETGIQHKLWIEQPENFPTCLATAPLQKDSIQQHFKKLKLCKGS